MTLFKRVSKPKNILDLITYDLSTFFYVDDYEEIYSEDIVDTFLIDYQKILPWKEFGIFNKVVFRVFIEKAKLTGTNHINVTFHSESDTVPLDKAQSLLSELESLYGKDDNLRSLDSAEERANLKQGNIVRMWTLDAEQNVYGVRLNLKQGEGMQLQIMFYTNLVKSLGLL